LRAVRYDPPVSILLALILFCVAAVVFFGALLVLFALRAIRASDDEFAGGDGDGDSADKVQFEIN
jgi:hypothetical protein